MGDMIRPGFKTTEFWGRAITTLMGLAVGGGIVQPEVGQKINDATSAVLPVLQAVIDGVIQIVGIVGAFWLQYQQGRERFTLKNNALSSRSGAPAGAGGGGTGVSS